MKMRLRKLLAVIMVLAMALTLNVGMSFAGNTNYAYADGGTVVMNITYGDQTVSVTDTEMATLSQVTKTYSSLTKGGTASSDSYTGVLLTDVLNLANIQISGLDDSQTLTFKASDGYSKVVTVKSLLRTTRYSYELVGGIITDNDNKVEVPAIITTTGTTIGMLVTGQTSTTDFNKQYWVTKLMDGTASSITVSGDLWNGNIASGFQSGSGTSGDPYMIQTGSQLAYLAAQVNFGATTYEGVYFKLANDLNLNDQVWTPIGGVKNSQGVATYQFKGIFDGNDKTIKGLNVQWATDYAGLFGFNLGTIKNLTVVGAVNVAPAGSITEGVADYVGGVCGFNAGTITRVISKVTITANKSNSIGGIAGFNTSGKFIGYLNGADTQCSVPGAIGSITECGNTGAIVGMKKIGGITGENAGTVSKCYNTADILSTYSGSGNGYGGIVGRNGNNNTAYETATVANCYNTGTIGPYSGSDSRWYAGISGFSNIYASIINCYTIGTIKAGYKDYYPISARMDSPATAVTNAYSLDTLLGYDVPATYTSSYYGIEKTSSEMKDSGFLTALGGAFVADNGGDTAINGGYPVLRWQSAAAATVTVSKVEMTAQPTKTAYVEGQTFNIDGMVLTATYSDNSTEVLTKADYQVSNTNELQMADTGETISGSLGGVSFTFDVPITVAQNDLQSIKVTTGPTKIAYESGSTFDPAGMAITATYTNGKTARLTTGFTSTDTALTDSAKTITVSYEMPGTGTVKADSFDATIIDLNNKPLQDQEGTYLITNAAELLDFSAMVGQLGQSNLNAKLVNDIDLSGVAYVPIGVYINKTVPTTNGGNLYYYQYNTYNGTFDGDGKTLNIVMTGSSNAAAFGVVGNGTIKDLTVSGQITSTGGNAAGIVAQVYSGTPTITDCTNRATVSGTTNVAGIVGSGSGGTIANCRNEGSVTGTSNYIGGIAGNAGTTEISGSVNKGAVTGISGTGGIVGGTNAAISDSGNLGTVVGTYNVGGVAGNYNLANGTISGCFNTGNTTGNYSVGGIYGSGYGKVIQNCYNWGDITASAGTTSYGVGGLIGTQGNYVITDLSACYNSGTITGSNGVIYTGALVGLSKKGGVISNSYYLTGGAAASVGATATGYTTTDGSLSKTAAEMKGLDVDLGSAYISPGTNYPVLAWQTEGSDNALDLLAIVNQENQNNMDGILDQLEDANNTIDDLNNQLDGLQDQLDDQTAMMNQQMDDLKQQLASSKVSADITTKAASYNYNTVSLSWTKISGATGYQILRYDSAAGKYAVIKTITNPQTVTCKDSGRTTGQAAYYRVRAYAQYTDSTSQIQTVYGTQSPTAKAIPIPGKVSLTSVKAGSKSVTITWSAVAGASGYEISVSTGSTATKVVKTISGGSIVKYTKTSLTKGTKYYVKVRAYRTVSGKKVYGGWSTVKSVIPV